MIVIAGPPGSGKSAAFPAASFGVDSFNADDQAALLNGGSYRNIGIEVRTAVNRLFENFVLEHITGRNSLCFETTLRSAITFDQANLARGSGFAIEMRYVGLKSYDLNIERCEFVQTAEAIALRSRFCEPFSKPAAAT